MSDKAAETLARALIVIALLAAMVVLLCTGHDTAAVWAFIAMVMVAL